MKSSKVAKKTAVVTKAKLKKQTVQQGGCGRCLSPVRDEHPTVAGTWLPSDTLCGKCRRTLIETGENLNA